jgi:hypothetical protein
MWIRTAWQCISPEPTVEGFRKCYISNAIDGTEDYILWSESEEDGHVRSECEEDEGTDLKMETLTLIGKGR